MKILSWFPIIWQAVTAEDIDNGNYTIDDIVLPLPG